MIKDSHRFQNADNIFNMTTSEEDDWFKQILITIID